MMTRILFLEINLHIIAIKLTDFLSYPSYMWICYALLKICMQLLTRKIIYANFLALLSTIKLFISYPMSIGERFFLSCKTAFFTSVGYHSYIVNNALMKNEHHNRVYKNRISLKQKAQFDDSRAKS